MFRSAISVTSRSGRLAATAICRIGMAPGSNFWMTGASAVSGRSGMTRLTLSRTSWAATSPLFSSRKVMMTCDWPSIDERPQRVDAADRVDGAFDLLGDLGFDLLGRGAGIGHRHGDRRHVDVRQQIDAKADEGVAADHRQRQHEHRRQHRTPNAEFRQLVHRVGLYCAADGLAPGGWSHRRRVCRGCSSRQRHRPRRRCGCAPVRRPAPPVGRSRTRAVSPSIT